MDTEELITILAADRSGSVRPRLILRLAAGAIVSAVLVLTAWGVRPGWPGLPQDPVMLSKSLWPLAAIGRGLAAMWLVTVASGGVVFGNTIMRCPLSVPLLAAPVGVALFSGLRYRVILDPSRAGIVAGLCAGAVGAATYALHCNEDAASIYLLWYGLRIGCCGLVGAIADRKLLGV